MSEYKSTIILVFYDGVKPTELRWVEGGKGVYAQALRELQKIKKLDGQQRYRSEELEKWKTALSAVADITGFDGEKYKRSFSVSCSGTVLRGSGSAREWRVSFPSLYQHMQDSADFLVFICKIDFKGRRGKLGFWVYRSHLRLERAARAERVRGGGRGAS